MSSVTNNVVTNSSDNSLNFTGDLLYLKYLPNNLLSLEYSSEESSDSGFSKSCKLGIPPKRFKKL